MIESTAASTQNSQLVQTTPFFYSESERALNRLAIKSPGKKSEDKVTISPEARSIKNRQEELSPDDDKASSKTSAQNINQLPPEEQREVTKLQRRDAEVRAHEQAHVSAAGQHAAGGMSFTYEVGPNGKRYATGGEVPIDLSRESTPEETIAKMQQVAKAALAPANPSAADRNIAARAQSIAAEARREINEAASPEKDDDGSERATVQGTQDAMNIRTSPADSITSEKSNSSSFMPSRQMILRAYTQIS